MYGAMMKRYVTNMAQNPQNKTAELWKMKYLSLPAAVYFPLISRSKFVLLIFQRWSSSKDGGGWSRFVFWLLTSLISFILAPPFPMREPHWLAGMTSRRVTGGLELMVPLATSAVRSWREMWGRKKCGESRQEGKRRG